MNATLHTTRNVTRRAMALVVVVLLASLFLLKAPRADFSAQIDDAIAKREAARSRKHAVSDEAVEDAARERESAPEGEEPETFR